MTKKQKQTHKELKILSEQISEERDIRIQGGIVTGKQIGRAHV